MNRRQFTQSLAALFATPALPVKALAATTPPVSSLAVCWADYLTKLHKVCTPEMLRPFLRVDAATAKVIHARLVTHRILTPSGAAHPDILSKRSPLPKQAKPYNKGTKKQLQKEPPKMSDSLTTRSVDSSDLDALTAIWHESWHLAHAAHVPEELTVQRTLHSFKIRLAAMLENTRTIGPLGAPLGFCSIRGDELYQIFVDPAAHGTGVAKTLIQDAELRLRNQGTKTARLDCIPQNSRALAFYMRHGWNEGTPMPVEVDTLDGKYTLECLVLTKEL